MRKEARWLAQGECIQLPGHLHRGHVGECMQRALKPTTLRTCIPCMMHTLPIFS